MGAESLASTVRSRGEARPAYARFGYLLLGLGAGALSGFVLPNRFLRHDGLALLTLLVNPALAGLALRRYGYLRRSAGHRTTHLATFLGAAALAFGVSLGRLLVVFL